MWRRHDKQVHRVVLKSPLDNEAKADQEYVSTHSGKAQLEAKLEKLYLHNPFKMYIHFLIVQDHSSVGHFMQERR